MKKGGIKLKSFLNSLGRREKQVTLRAFFHQESQKNSGGCTDNPKVQTTLSFFESCSKKMQLSEQDNGFLTPQDNMMKLKISNEP